MYKEWFGLKEQFEKEKFGPEALKNLQAFNAELAKTKKLTEEECLDPPKWLLDYEINSNKFKAACNQYYMGINVNLADGADESKIGMSIQIDLERKKVSLIFWRINLVNNLDVENLKKVLGDETKFTGPMGSYDVGPNRNRFEFTFEDDTDLQTKLDAIKTQFLSLTYINETDLTRFVKRTIMEMEEELQEAQLVNNITDYQGGVQYILRDPAQAEQVAETIKQWTTKKGFTIVKHTKSKTGKLGYFYFRLGQDPGTEAQKIQGYFSQLPELKHFRFNVVNQQPPQPTRRPQGKI